MKTYKAEKTQIFKFFNSSDAMETLPEGAVPFQFKGKLDKNTVEGILPEEVDSEYVPWEEEIWIDFDWVQRRSDAWSVYCCREPHIHRSFVESVSEEEGVSTTVICYKERKPPFAGKFLTGNGDFSLLQWPNDETPYVIRRIIRWEETSPGSGEFIPKGLEREDIMAKMV